MKILYQNNVSGDAYNVTTLCTAAKWTTKRRDSPASMQLTLIQYDSVEWTHGGILAVIDDDNNGIFYGYVTTIKRTNDGYVTITAYDQLLYMKNNSATYVFYGKRADEIIRQMANDFWIKCGELENTGYTIPQLIQDGKSLLDTATKAVDYTLINAGKLFTLWDDYGKLRLTETENLKLNLLIGDNSMANSYTYTSDIAEETYNRIKLAQNNSDTGARDVYVYEDSGNMKLWGILQKYEVVDESLNAAQIKEYGAQMLELYNRPKKSFTINALLDTEVRAGKAVYIRISDLDVSAFFIVEEHTADLLNGTMKLTLKVA